MAPEERNLPRAPGAQRWDAPPESGARMADAATAPTSPLEVISRPCPSVTDSLPFRWGRPAQTAHYASALGLTGPPAAG